MLTLSQVFSFLITAVILTVTPGPDNLMLLGISLSKGRRQGIVFGIGCALGCLSHTLISMLGVGMIIISSPNLFAILKFLGGVYLIYLGANILLTHKYAKFSEQKTTNYQNTSLMFIKGLCASSINPKVALFFISFLPQFVVSHQGHVVIQLGVLSIIFIGQAIVIFSLIGYFSGSIGNVLRCNPKAGFWLDRISGSLLVLLGIRTWIIV
jgi:threonine/homoserine/homoserine lactone efflux protein